MRDLMNHIATLVAIAPFVATDNTAAVSTILDTSGGQSATVVIATGTLADADATFAVLLEEGDASNLSDAAAVADVDLIGTEALAGFTFAADGKTRKLGYIGNKRYIRLTVTPSANAGNAPISAIWIKSHLDIVPAANPTA